MIFFYRYLRGCLKVKFYGEFPERILNLCAENRITLWGSKSVEGGICGYITLKDFYFLPYIIRGTKIRIHIEEKYGFPFVISRYKKRWGISLGVIIFFCFLQFMSSFIWIIDVRGNETVKTESIIENLGEIGIHKGMYSGNILPKNDSQRLLLKMDSLAWASLNIEGSRLTVNITETKGKKEEDTSPCNLKAKYDGVIKKIDLKSGNGVVKVGDTVKKGDVLVSGIIENAGGTRFVHSSGDVLATVEHTFTLTEKITQNLTEENGEYKKRRVLEFFNIKIPLFLGDETKPCNQTLKVDNLKIFGTQLPVAVHTKTYCYTEKVTVTKTEDVLKGELEEKMEEMLKRKKIKDYKLKSKEFTTNSEEISLKFTVTAEQNIAYKDFLIISTGN